MPLWLDNLDSEQLLIAASALAAFLSKDLKPLEIELIASFLSATAELMGVIAVNNELLEINNSKEK